MNLFKEAYMVCWDFAFKLGWKGHPVFVNKGDSVFDQHSAELRPSGEVFDWLKDNTKGSWIWHNRINNHLAFYFSRKDEAARFKLTW